MTMKPTNVTPFVFPPWSNKLPPVSGAAVVIGLCLVILGLWYYASPKHTDVGYMPEQPIPYSHLLHAGQMGMDCRYCHVNVERSWVASVPPTQVCMNCHTNVKKDSKALDPLWCSWTEYKGATEKDREKEREQCEKRVGVKKGDPVPWLRVHKSPDYVYFPHNRHVTRGVGCVECHGRIDTMEKVYQSQPLSMGWCLDCHREPAARLRPVEEITNMNWEPPAGETRASFGQKLVEKNKIEPPTDCSRCHR